MTANEFVHQVNSILDSYATRKGDAKGFVFSAIQMALSNTDFAKENMLVECERYAGSSRRLLVTLTEDHPLSSPKLYPISFWFLTLVDTRKRVGQSRPVVGVKLSADEAENFGNMDIVAAAVDVFCRANQLGQQATLAGKITSILEMDARLLDPTPLENTEIIQMGESIGLLYNMTRPYVVGERDKRFQGEVFGSVQERQSFFPAYARRLQDYLSEKGYPLNSQLQKLTDSRQRLTPVLSGDLLMSKHVGAMQI